MKNLIYLFLALVTGIAPMEASEMDGLTNRPYRYDGTKYIFIERGIEFSVYPDGEFDFLLPQVEKMGGHFLLIRMLLMKPLRFLKIQ